MSLFVYELAYLALFIYIVRIRDINLFQTVVYKVYRLLIYYVTALKKLAKLLRNDILYNLNEPLLNLLGEVVRCL